jgi:hypothetical protein
VCKLIFCKDMLSDFTKMAEDHVSTNVKLIDGSASDEAVRYLFLLRYVYIDSIV